MVHKAKKLLILLIIFSIFIPLNNVFADEEERLTVSTEIGFDDKIKQQQGFPIAVIITNNGPDISGELVITVSPGWNSNVGNIISSVDIPANSEKTVKLNLPGHGDMHYSNQNVEHIHFYEGGWQNGKKVEVGGQTKLNPRMYNEEDIIVGLFTDHPDSFNFLKSVSRAQGNSYTTIPIDAEIVPTDPMGLAMFSILLIDQYSIAGLSNDQQAAIKSWVSNGGRLIVGGDLGVEQKLGQLSAFLPMKTDIKTEAVSTEFFNKENVREYPTETIEFITGVVSEDAQVLQKTEDGTPIVLSRSLGKGEVIQLSFSPSANTFANWEGASSYWTDAIQPRIQNNQMHYESVYDRLNWSLAQTTNLFPSSFLPFSVLVITFLVYILIIFPTIYFLLRKMDKREHSWWILPAISLLICLGIFGFGGKDRIAQPQINEVTLLQLDEQGFGQGYGSIALLSNRSGNYSLNINTGNFAPFPIRDNQMFSESYEGKTGILHQGDQIDVLYNDVDYWSIRNVSGPILAMEIGNFESDLKIADKKVIGTVTNRTELSFDDLILMSGRQEVSIGAVGPGETIKVSFELTGSILTAPTWRNQYSQTTDLQERKREDVLRYLQEFDMFTRGKPAIIGLTRDEVLQTTLDGHQALIDRMNVIVQSLDIKDAFGGPFNLVTEDLTPNVYMIEGNGYVDSMDLERGGKSVYASAGVFEFGYTVPRELVGEETTFTELEIKIRNSSNFTYEILNQEAKYEPLDDANTFDNPEKYIDEYGYLVIRVTKSDMPDQLQVPEVSLKGDRRHD